MCHSLCQFFLIKNSSGFLITLFRIGLTKFFKMVILYIEYCSRRMFYGGNDLGKRSGGALADNGAESIDPVQGRKNRRSGKAGETLDETYGLIETAEKAAEIYLKIAPFEVLQTITDEKLAVLGEAFGVCPRAGYLEEAEEELQRAMG